MRVRWIKPPPRTRTTGKERKTPGRKSGTRTALLFSLALHLVALLTLKSVMLNQRRYDVSNAVHVALLSFPKSKSVTDPPPLPRRAVEPVRKPRTRRVETSAGKLSQDRLPERSITAKITDEKAREARIPTISASISRDRPLQTPLPGGASAIGASSRKRGKSDRSGTAGGEGNMGGLASISHNRTPVDGGTMADDLQVYPEAELPFIQALEKIAQHVVKVRKSRKVDIVFIIDTSESMQNDIDAVRRHLNRMIDRFEVAGLDFTLGVVRFHHSMIYEWLGMDITISPQTSDMGEVREILRSIRVSGGERALDALMKAIDKVEFRPGADRHFLLVTDEYVHGTYPVPEVLKAAKRAKITIDVLGRDEVFQKTIAEQTGGIWTSIRKVRQRNK